jgi:RNA polymerase sigma factor (TIGR02999 family)
MSDVTRILSQIEQGDPLAAEKLLPLVYEELRKLAAAKLAQEKPGQTLQATALVHEAYVRLVDGQPEQHWNSRGHFFGAAAEAMRRILVDSARRKAGLQHGGNRQREDLPLDEIESRESPGLVLAIDQALKKLARENEPVARLVELRYFAGLTVDEAAKILGVTDRTARRYWVYAKSWLLTELGPSDALD